MTATRSRLFPALGVLLAGGMFLTACGSEDSAASNPARPSSAPVAATGAVAGTFTGTLTYWAPGKLRVGERAFWVAQDTQIWGSGGICGDGKGHSLVECTVGQLEKAAKKGTVRVEVTVGKDGIASKVVDQTPNKTAASGGEGAGGNSGVAGTFAGTLTYWAPGKLRVGERAFWLANDTEIWGSGGICGDGKGHSLVECTVGQLEKAAKKGTVRVEVTVGKDGIASKV
ncbi:hypothetical protein LZ269_36020, partial [Streptomyces lomondensis]